MIRSLLQRILRLDRDHLVATDADDPRAVALRHRRAVADLATWLAGGAAPPEPAAPPGQWCRSRVWAMLDAADLLLDSSARVIASGIDDPAQIGLDGLRTLLPEPTDEATDPLFGLPEPTDAAIDSLFGPPEPPAAPQRPAKLPPAWSALADRIAALRAVTQPSVGDEPEMPDPAFL